ncbi:MAG: glycosyltransferase family 9 protein [Ignavibacteria bacterium]
MKKTPEKDVTSFAKLKVGLSPEKILVIRLHAVGDAALTMPACSSLRKRFPAAEIDFLTIKNIKGLISAFNIFDCVYFPESGFDFIETGYESLSQKFLRFKSVFKIGLVLRKKKYDAVIDLQNNRYSRIIRKLTGAKCFSEFDRYEAKPHSERVLDAFSLAGFKGVQNDFNLNISAGAIQKGEKILNDNGWVLDKKLIMLNPAGLYETRMWGDENYQQLGMLLIKAGYMLLLAGTEKMKKKAAEYKDQFGNNLIDITGKTALEDIPGILFHTSGIVSDDSGLFHISWAMGKPGVLLLGATRADWTCQPGLHTICLNSSDLECGNCMKEICKWGDTRCLKRYEPRDVYSKLMELMTRKN